MPFIVRINDADTGSTTDRNGNNVFKKNLLHTFIHTPTQPPPPPHTHTHVRKTTRYLFIFFLQCLAFLTKILTLLYMV